MKNNRFLIWQLKEWAVTLGLIALGFISIQWVITIQYGRYEYLSYHLTPLLCIFSLIVASILPFMIFTYRYSKKKADTFLQIPCDNGQIKKIRTLLLLAFLVVLIIFTFFTTLGLQALSMAEFDLGENFTIFDYFLQLLIILFGAIGQFGITTFLVSRGNSLRDSLIYFCAGEIILYSLPTVFFAYLVNFSFGTFTFASEFIYSSNLKTFSFVQIIIAIFNWGYWLNSGEYYDGFETVAFVFTFVTIAISIAVGIYAYLAKEPSGDRAGRPGPNNLFDKIVIHAGFVTLGCLEFYTNNFPDIGYFLSFLLFAAFYYGILISYYHSVHLDKKTWITYGIVLFWTFLSTAIWPHITIDTSDLTKLALNISQYGRISL